MISIRRAIMLWNSLHNIDDNGIVLNYEVSEWFLHLGIKVVRPFL